jgi:hypothetical protein
MGATDNGRYYVPWAQLWEIAGRFLIGAFFTIIGSSFAFIGVRDAIGFRRLDLFLPAILGVVFVSIGLTLLLHWRSLYITLSDSRIEVRHRVAWWIVWHKEWSFDDFEAIDIIPERVKNGLSEFMRWLQHVQMPQTEAELAALRRSVVRGSPFGEVPWQERTAKRLGLQSTLRARGRPCKPQPAPK